MAGKRGEKKGWKKGWKKFGKKFEKKGFNHYFATMVELTLVGGAWGRV